MKKCLSFLIVLALSCCSFGDIYLAGDSTMCNYRNNQYPQQGWGQALYEFMKNPDQLHNLAIGGRSARSYRNEGRWDKLVSQLKGGDYVIVAFGHNDANRAKKERYSSKKDYSDFMRGFANEVRAKGASIIYATSIPHSGGVTVDTNGVTHVRASSAGLGPYVAATIELGRELNVPVLDLNGYAAAKFERMGADKVYPLYMRIKPGEYKNYPDGKKDACHTRDTGAFFFAKAAVTMCFERKLSICSLFKNPAQVTHTPIPFEGPGAKAKALKDDFSKEEIPYANEGAMRKGNGKRK